MKNQMKRKNSHRRSSSVVEDIENCSQVSKTHFVSQLTSSETMQLLERCQNQSQFQTIVDSFETEQPVSPPSDLKTLKIQAKKRQQPRKAYLGDYFQIQEVQTLKRTSTARQNMDLSVIALDKLDGEPKTNSRLRYHVHAQVKAFNDANQKLLCFKNYPSVALNEKNLKSHFSIKA